MHNLYRIRHQFHWFTVSELTLKHFNLRPDQEVDLRLAHEIVCFCETEKLMLDFIYSVRQFVAQIPRQHLKMYLLGLKMIQMGHLRPQVLLLPYKPKR